MTRRIRDRIQVAASLAGFAALIVYVEWRWLA